MLPKNNLKSLFAPLSPPSAAKAGASEECNERTHVLHFHAQHGDASGLPITRSQASSQLSGILSSWKSGQFLRRVRVIGLEVFAGALTYFFMTVFVVAYAATIPPSNNTESTEMLAGEFARSSVLAYVACGTGYLALTRLPFAQPIGPDLAIAPMMAQVAQAVVVTYGDLSRSITIQHDAALIILLLGAVGAIVSGALISGMSRFGLLRFAEYLPFPVVAGLLAATGVGLIRAGLHLAGGLDMDLWAAAIIAIADLCLTKCKVSPPARFAICVLAPSLSLILASWMNLDSKYNFSTDNVYFPEYMFGADALMRPPPLLSALLASLKMRDAEEPRLGRALEACGAALEASMAMILLTVLKAPVVDAALRRALQVSTASNDRSALGRLTTEEFACRRKVKDTTQQNRHHLQQKKEKPTASAAHDMVLLGVFNIISGVLGSGAVLGQSVSMAVAAKGVRGVKPWSKLPGIACLIFALISVLCGPFAASHVPKFVYAGLVASAGTALVERWLIQPATYLSRNETGVTLILVALTAVRGFATGVAAGAAASVLLFAVSSIHAPVVKYLATGQTFRSNVQRDAEDSDILDQQGDGCAIIILTGYLFFGNGAKLLTFVDALLDDEEDDENKNLATYLVLDLALCLGADASAIDAILEAARKVGRSHDSAELERNGPAVYLANPPEALRSALRKRGASVDKLVRCVLDADRAFGSCEDRLLASIKLSKGTQSKASRNREHSARIRRPSAELSELSALAGLLHTTTSNEKPAPALSQQQFLAIEEKTHDTFCTALRFSLSRTHLSTMEDGPTLFTRLEEGLAPRASLLQLGRDQTLMSRARAGEPCDAATDALYLVARGRVNVRYDPSQTTGQLFLRTPQNSVSALHSAPRRRKTVARPAGGAHSRPFRLSELGPGSLIGVEEFCTRLRSVGVFLAAADTVIVYKIPFNAIDDLILSDPLFGVAFFRLVATILADDATMLKSRLSNTVDAFYAKPLRAPISRRTLRSFAAAAVS